MASALERSDVSEAIEEACDETYKDEYTKDFVSHWDDLIGWEGREKGEDGFFHRLLGVQNAKSVADVACGTGFHSVILARDGFEVTATDGAANMVRKTLENAKRYGVELADTRVVEWQNLHEEFGENRFDALLCLGNAFTHLFDHESRRESLASMYKILKPGGMAVIDHRNYDGILDEGYSSKHKYYYTGKGVDVYPIQIDRTVTKFQYTFPDGETFHLTLYPLKQGYMSHLFEDAGFVEITRYGDFRRPYDKLDVDFIQQVAFNPR